MTRIFVARCRTWSATLSCFGDKCKTMTNAMPASLGMFSNRRSKVWMPPAEAPMPTTGKASELVAKGFSGSEAGVSFGVLLFVMGSFLHRGLNVTTQRGIGECRSTIVTNADTDLQFSFLIDPRPTCGLCFEV